VLVKLKDKHARAGSEPTVRKVRSVLSGLTIEEMGRAA
jgi:hypothetical protein